MIVIQGTFAFASTGMDNVEARKFITDCYRQILILKQYNKFDACFAPSFTSTVDGIKSTHDQFIEHLHFLSTHLSHLKIKVFNVVADPARRSFAVRSEFIFRKRNNKDRQLVLFNSFFVLDGHNRLVKLNEISYPLTPHTRNNIGYAFHSKLRQKGH